MIIFTNHTLLKLEQRGISKAAIAETLNSPDYKFHGYSNRMIAYKKTVEIAPEINLDLDKENKPLYLEIIGASEKIGRERVNEILMKNLIPAKV